MISITKQLHRHLWQHLPYHWRRSALFLLSSFLAPRPAAKAAPQPPIYVAGALSTASGLGQSARLCHDALKANGEFPVFGVDLTSALMQPEDAAFAFADGWNRRGPGTLILHVNAPFVPLALWRLGQRFVSDKHIIGVWHWELPRTPADWRHGAPFVHEIWVSSRFAADAVQPIAAGRPVRVVPLPVALQGPVPVASTRPPGRPFTVLTVFNAASSIARKNPLAAIAAFRLAFGDDPSARLIVKAANASVFPPGFAMIENAVRAANNIVLISETMSDSEIDKLYRDSDVVLSLHRSEGFGLILAEAMIRGLPVVATDWSGNVDFVTAQTGIPVPYRLIPAEDPQGTYQHPELNWADADVTAAADALRRLRHDPELARRLGETAAAFVAQAFSAQSYSDTVRRQLRADLGSPN
jgi:glycosyltransferase involved in cell wall biosynthesis